MTKIAFGPVAGVKNGTGYYLNVPFTTHGDWRKTKEGQTALEEAMDTVKKRYEKLVSENAEIDWQGDDLAILRVPFKNVDSIRVLGEEMKKNLPTLLHATLLQPLIRRSR